MSEDGPGAALRALVLAAVSDDLVTPETAVTVVEREDNPGPIARLSGLVKQDGASDDGETAIVGMIPHIDRSLARQIVGDLDADTRLVFTGAAGERLDGPAGGAIRSALAAHGVTAYRHDGDSPLGVLLVGERAVVGLFDERGLAAVLWSDAAPVREWAAATCRRFFAAAESV